MKLLLLLSLELVVMITALETIRCDKQIQCNHNSLIKADTNIAKILTLGQSDRRYPENDRQTVGYCQ